MKYPALFDNIDDIHLAGTIMVFMLIIGLVTGALISLGIGYAF